MQSKVYPFSHEERCSYGLARNNSSSLENKAQVDRIIRKRELTSLAHLRNNLWTKFFDAELLFLAHS